MRLGHGCHADDGDALTILVAEGERRADASGCPAGPLAIGTRAAVFAFFWTAPTSFMGASTPSRLIITVVARSGTTI